MSDQSLPVNAPVRNGFFYGWVIVAACTLMLAVTYGLMYSYSVFFKPLADHFNWDRATVSLIYSVSLVVRGAISIGTGWLADKYGAARLMVFCGFVTGLGLVLTSQVQTLWQFFITYALIEALGLSGAFGVATAMTARWFTRNRGLALGIVSCGVGIGTILIVPGTERLINAMDWSWAFIVCGIVSGVLVIGSALFLRMPPKSSPLVNNGGSKPAAAAPRNGSQRDLSLSEAVRDSRVIISATIFALFIFCIQMILVHLVNYATDIGISSLVAAGFISLVGASSVGGRLAIGAGADRFGLYSTMTFCIVTAIAAMLVLIFVKEVWAFFLFAVIFGFAYGGEVPQIPLFVGRFCGTKAMAALVGLILFVANIGGALGPWVGGKIYDLTSNYQWAFTLGTLSLAAALVLTLVLKKQDR